MQLEDLADAVGHLDAGALDEAVVILGPHRRPRHLAPALYHRLLAADEHRLAARRAGAGSGQVAGAASCPLPYRGDEVGDLGDAADNAPIVDLIAVLEDRVVGCATGAHLFSWAGFL